jgi:hypothetical protein
MRFIFVAALMASFSAAPASALTIDGYELLIRKSESRDPKTEPYVAKAMLYGHLAGVAEAIQVSQTGTQSFRVGERKLLCFPSNVRLTADLLRGALDAELKQPQYLQQTLGAEWRHVPLAFALAITLQRMFPCPAE